MSNEVQDGHACESCIRWPECNGVDWPECQELKCVADIKNMLERGLITQNEARRRIGLPPI